MTPTAINQTAKNAAEMFGYKANGVQKSILALKKHKAFTGDIETYVNNMIGSEYFDEALAVFGYEMALIVCTDYDKYFSEERATKAAHKVVKEQKKKLVKITKKAPAKFISAAESAIIKQALLPHVSTNEFRDSLRHVTIMNGYAYASDAHTLARLKVATRIKTPHLMRPDRFTCSKVHLVKDCEQEPCNFESVIPRDNETKITVSRSALLKLILLSEREFAAGGKIRKTGNQVRFYINGGNVAFAYDELYRHGSEQPKDILREFNIASCEGNLLIGFSSALLKRALRSLDTEMVTLAFGTQHRAVIITSDENKNLLQLVMPVRLSS